MKSYSVGLIGFGNVNRAFIEHYLSISKKIKEDFGFGLNFVAVCDSKTFVYKKNLDIIDLIQKKQKGELIGKFCTDVLVKLKNVLKKKKIDILIDGLPTSKIDEGQTFQLLTTALEKDINVICVNKAPLVFKGAELFRLAKNSNAKIGISATTAGSLPAAGLMINELIGSEVIGVRGILNSTSNYVLDSVMFDNLTIYEAVKKSVKLGIAEPEYRFDLEGIDTSFKMIILGLLITGKGLKPKDVPCKGIMNLDQKYIRSIVKKNKVIRLIGNLSITDDGKQEISVAPEILDATDPLYAVRGAGKGATFKTKYMGDLTVTGVSSGRTNIAATILKDVINITK